MTRACNTLFYSSLTLIWTAVAAAQQAPTSPVPPQPVAPKGAEAAPRAPVSAPPAAEGAPSTSAPAASPPLPGQAPPAAPPASNSPAPNAPTPPGRAPAAPTTGSAPTNTSPAPAVPTPALNAPDAVAPVPTATPTAPSAQSSQAAPGAPASVADDAEPKAEAPPAERKPSLLDPHPPGYLPPIYERDTRKHEGFSIRLSAGLGFGSSTRKLAGDDYKVSGLVGLLSLDIGASVIENLIIYGRFSGFAWNSLLGSDTANAGGSYLGLLGAGARYYLMPYNIFGSATLGVAATQVLDDLGNAQNAHPGFGFELEVGHDFWAGTPLDQRAIGLALRFGYVIAGAAGTREKDPRAWNSFAITLLFAAAYN